MLRTSLNPAVSALAGRNRAELTGTARQVEISIKYQKVYQDMTAIHGGARPGSGRPAGIKNKATLDREALAREATARSQAARLNGSNGPSPDDIASMTALEVMSFAMTQLAIEGEWTAAAAIAKDIAPYRHAKLTQTKIDATIRRSVKDMTEDELTALLDDEGDESDGADKAPGL